MITLDISCFETYEQYLQGLRDFFGGGNQRPESNATKTMPAGEARARRVGAASPGNSRRIIRRTIGDRFRDFDKAPEMLVVPGGEVLMGASEGDRERLPFELPPHAEQIAPFAVGIYPVTFAEWDAAVEAGAVRWKPPDNGWGRACMPIVNVSWDDVQDYLAWLGEQSGVAYRLLSEAEFEYLARAGSNAPWPWGQNAQPKLDENAWYSGNAGGRAQQVGKKLPNSLGFHDLLGNVDEWMADAWRPDYRAHPGDGLPVQSGVGSQPFRVVRGGSWLDSPRALRVSARNRQPPTHRSYRVGFRVARDV